MPKILQIILSVTLALAFVGGGYYFFVAPLSAKSEGLKMQADRLKRENDQDWAFRQEQVGYLLRIEMLRKRTAELRAIIPDEPETDRLERMIREVGRATGVRVRTFAVRRPVSHDFYVELPLTVEFEGPYLSILNFLTRLGQTQRIVNVSDFSLRPPGGYVSPDFSLRPNALVVATCVVSSYSISWPAAPPPKP